MDIMWVAIAVDMTIYMLVGIAIARLGHHILPAPWNRISFTVPLVLVVGALVTMATFPHWLVFPR